MTSFITVRRTAVAAVVLSAALLGACSSSSTTTTAAPAPAPTMSAPAPAAAPVVRG